MRTSKKSHKHLKTAVILLRSANEDRTRKKTKPLQNRHNDTSLSMPDFLIRRLLKKNIHLTIYFIPFIIFAFSTYTSSVWLFYRQSLQQSISIPGTRNMFSSWVFSSSFLSDTCRQKTNRNRNRRTMIDRSLNNPRPTPHLVMRCAIPPPDPPLATRHSRSGKQAAMPTPPAHRRRSTEHSGRQGLGHAEPPPGMSGSSIRLAAFSMPSPGTR